MYDGETAERQMLCRFFIYLVLYLSLIHICQTVVLQRLGIAAVQGYALLDIDAVIVGIGGVLLQRLHIVADLALRCV